MKCPFSVFSFFRTLSRFSELCLAFDALARPQEDVVGIGEAEKVPTLWADIGLLEFVLTLFLFLDGFSWVDCVWTESEDYRQCRHHIECDPDGVHTVDADRSLKLQFAWRAGCGRT